MKGWRTWLKRSAIGLAAVCLLTIFASWVIYKVTKAEATDLQTILTTMFASLCGGAFTMAGVLFTIDEADRDKKEEEIKKAKPYLNLVPIKDATEETKDTTTKDVFDDVYQIEVDGELGEWGDSLETFAFEVENISDALLIFKDIKINGESYKRFTTEKIIRKGAKIRFLMNGIKDYLNKIDKVELYGEDILGNLYKYDISLDSFISPIDPPKATKISLPIWVEKVKSDKAKSK